MQKREALKTVALGTSKINYLDPRITVAWWVWLTACKAGPHKGSTWHANMGYAHPDAVARRLMKYSWLASIVRFTLRPRVTTQMLSAIASSSSSPTCPLVAVLQDSQCTEGFCPTRDPCAFPGCVPPVRSLTPQCPAPHAGASGARCP